MERPAVSKIGGEVMDRTAVLAVGLLNKIAHKFLQWEEAETVEPPVALHTDERGKPTLEYDRRNLDERQRRNQVARELALSPDFVFTAKREQETLIYKLVDDHRASI
jgi:hypothetical protein